MAEPITIGGQKFIKNEKGWIDQKTKAKAPEGLISLLDKVSEEQSPEGMKKRAILDNTYTIKLGDSEYIWDMNNQIFVDKKTKNPVPKHLSSIIEAAAGMKKAGAEDKSKAASSVVNNMGSAGQAAKQKVTTRTGSGQLPAPNIKINSPIVQMIEKLATIDGYLKQRLDNQKKIAANNNAMIREASIEAAGQLDAEPVIDEEKIKEEAEKENEKSSGAILAVAAIAAAALVSQLEPVKEAFSSVVDFAKTVYGYFKDFTNVTNTALESINSMFGDSPTKENKSSVGSSSVPAASNPVSPDASSTSTPTTAPAIAPNSGSKVSAPSPTPNSSSETTPKPATPTSTPAMASPTSTPKPATPTSTPAMASPTSIPKPATPTSTPKPATPAMATPTSTPKPATPAMATPNATPASAAPATPNATSASAAPATPNATSASATTRPADATKQTEQVGSSKPSDILQFTARTGSEANFRGLPPDFQRALLTAGAEYKQTYGEKLIITSARRSPDEQQRLLDEKAAGRSPNAGGVVAGKYSSPHVKGTGVDIGQAGKAANILAKQGIIWQAIPGDEVHYNYKGPGAATDGFWGSDSAKDSDSVLGKIVSTGVDLTQGAIEAIGTILRAGLGEMTPTSGSQLSTVNDTMSGNIARAARERTATVAETKTPKPVAAAKSDPVNMNAPSGSSTIQNMPTASDKAGVEFYLTRMGFPKIIYTQTSRGATLR